MQSLHSVTDVHRDTRGNTRTITTTADDGTGLKTRSNSMVWDSLDETFPYQLTNAAQQVKTVYYHAGLGVLAAVNDANGLSTVLRFDGFGRPRMIDMPSSADVSIDYAPSPNDVMAMTTSKAGGTTSKAYFNKWGRPVRTEITRLGGKTAVAENTYSRLNRLLAYTSPDYAAFQVLPPRVEMTYDNAGRIRQRSVYGRGLIGFRGQSAPDESETWTYDGMTQRHAEFARGRVAGRDGRRFAGDPNDDDRTPSRQFVWLDRSANPPSRQPI